MAKRRIERRMVTDLASKADVLPDESAHRHKVSQRDRMASLESNAILDRKAGARRRARAIDMTRCREKSGEAIPDAMAELSAQAQALRMGYD
ncbi:hypothetical protein L2Y90_29060 [Burkholderia pyrrocinia]|uniref:hypothetical protein n=1 Tax=Burkholderia pyrrocinia TaxID=60550 RepID=UPI00215AFFCB|nr:hypothetical protein [Burkholderia pyrrocinia]UVE68156.1 hypothetical protein L2Y90_29060 [Burkholderia pyrrocinia]